MEKNNKELENPALSSGSLDIESILEKRAGLDSILQNNFTKFITVMFTDMKGSTALTETESDMAVRLLIKKHNDIPFPIIEKHGGALEITKVTAP